MSPMDKYVTIAVLAEQAANERRVALVPREVGKLTGKARILVENHAGAAAGFRDVDYHDVGAETADRATILASADIALAVRPPTQIDALQRGASLISLGAHDADLTSFLATHGINHLALERLPRITRAQSMDVLSSQATVAGYAAVITGAAALSILLPMLTTAAGTIKPAKMMAVGAGVAGLQALATARRLGAITHGFDVRAAAREQVESIGAKFIFPETDVTVAETAGGYAGEQSTDQQTALRRALTPSLAEMQLVVTSAQIPGHAAPVLIDDDTLNAMQPGSVIVDLAAETGGNTSRTEPDKTITVNGVKIIGATQLGNQMATDASRLFSSNLRALLDHLVNEHGRFTLSRDDEITSALLGKTPFFEKT